MRRRIMITPPLGCLAALLATTCKGEEGYDCTATFSTEGGEVVSTEEYAYDDADTAQEAADLCKDDADADMPVGATRFSCHCEGR